MQGLVSRHLSQVLHLTFTDKERLWPFIERFSITDQKPGEWVQDCCVDICLCCTSCVECNETVSSEEEVVSNNRSSRRDEEPTHYKLYDESFTTRKMPVQTQPTSRTIIISDAFEDQVLRKQKTLRRYNDNKKPPYSKHK